jgi:hypothetical protein
VSRAVPTWLRLRHLRVETPPLGRGGGGSRPCPHPPLQQVQRRSSGDRPRATTTTAGRRRLGLDTRPHGNGKLHGGGRGQPPPRRDGSVPAVSAHAQSWDPGLLGGARGEQPRTGQCAVWFGPRRPKFALTANLEEQHRLHKSRDLPLHFVNRRWAQCPRPAAPRLSPYT